MSFGRRTLPPRVKSIPQRGTGRGVMGPAELGAPQPKGVKCKPGKQAPTKEEAEWMDRIIEHGCVACRIDRVQLRPAEVHHILSGGRRIGHLFTIPLCSGHHRDGTGAPGLLARHPFKARFEARYGLELLLLSDLRHLLRRQLPDAIDSENP